MAGIFTITVQEARGYTAVPADIDRLAVVMGCSSAGSGLSPFFLSGSSARTSRGYGDAVDTLCQIIEQRRDGGNGVKFPAAMYTTPADTDGSYGTIDVSGVTGTAVVSVDATSLPLGYYNKAKIRVGTGGTVGTAGITLQWSLDDGVNWSNITALGTDGDFTIPNSGVKFDFQPSSANQTALNTLINELFTDFNAHVILTTGTVHTNSGVADVVSAGTYPSATNQATRVARVNAIRAAYELHRAKGSGASPAIHINAPGDAVNVVTAPASTDDETALVLALELKTLLNAHEAGTTWHTIADATNTVSSPSPAAGTLVAGDTAAVRTFGPVPGADDIDAAFAALAAASTDFTILVCDWDMTAALLEHVATGLTTLAGVGKRVTALCRTRIPAFESSETEAAWLASVAAEYDDFEDSRICMRAGYGLVTDAMTSRQYRRSTLQQFAADVVRSPRAAWPCAPADPQTGLSGEPNVSLVDSTGLTIGHDEGPRGAATGLSNDTLGNRFSCEMRIPEVNVRESVFNTVPWVMYAADERIRNLMTRRLANAMQRVAVAAGLLKLGAKVFYTSTSPTTGILTAASRKSLQGSVFQAVSGEFATEIENAKDAALDTGLIQISPSITISGGNLVTVAGTIAPKVGGYVLSLGFTLAIQE